MEEEVVLSSPSPFDRKRRRDDGDHAGQGPVDKKAKPTIIQTPNDGERLWCSRDAAVETSPSQQQRIHRGEHAKYDSDDQSSMMSEPGSPQALSQASEEDVSMLSSDEGDTTHSVPGGNDDGLQLRSTPSIRNCWRSQLQLERVPTPGLSPRLNHRLLPGGHVRSRHPQENLSSERYSPIDEDEIATPPSAAEAAGSQLELLSVSDVDMVSDEVTPKITIHAERSLQLDGSTEDRMDSTSDGRLYPKTRARSDALSSGGGSPMREASAGLDKAFPVRKGFSMGFRADCEKCQQRVPGHMNHFY